MLVSMLALLAIATEELPFKAPEPMDDLASLIPDEFPVTKSNRRLGCGWLGDCVYSLKSLGDKRKCHWACEDLYENSCNEAFYKVDECKNACMGRAGRDMSDFLDKLKCYDYKRMNGRCNHGSSIAKHMWSMKSDGDYKCKEMCTNDDNCIGYQLQGCRRCNQLFHNRAGGKYKFQYGCTHYEPNGRDVPTGKGTWDLHTGPGGHSSEEHVNLCFRKRGRKAPLLKQDDPFW